MIGVQRAFRRNECTNPVAATDTTGWTNTGMATFERVTSLPTTDGLPFGITTGVHGVGDTSGDRISDGFAVVNGVVYTASAYLRVESLSATSVAIRITRGGGGTVNGTGVTDVGGSFARVSVTWTAAATGTDTVQVFQNGAGACDFHYTAVLTEASGAVNPYFDGSRGGYRWTGVAHASTSQTLRKIAVG